uniref:Uncharacterized protein n=1 Tax=Clytia hemisphaerica TaxID=252671 RepID=A0A7M5V2L1_9CNID
MTQWNIQDIEIRTRSVEKVLVPLIAQVGVLVNQGNNENYRDNVSEKVKTALPNLELSIFKFTSIGHEMGNANDNIRDDMVKSCDATNKACNTIVSMLNTDENNNATEPTNEKTLSDAAKILLSAITKILILADRTAILKLVKSAAKVNARLEELESVTNFTEFVNAFSQFGGDMVELAYVSGERQNDLRDELQRAEVCAARAILEKSTMMLLTTCKTCLRHPDSPLAKGIRGAVFQSMRDAMTTLKAVIENNECPGKAFCCGISLDLNNTKEGIEDLLKTPKDYQKMENLIDMVDNINIDMEDLINKENIEDSRKSLIKALIMQSKGLHKNLLEFVEDDQVKEDEENIYKTLRELFDICDEMLEESSKASAEQVFHLVETCEYKEVLARLKESALSGELDKVEETAERLESVLSEILQITRLTKATSNIDACIITATRLEENLINLMPQAIDAGKMLSAHPTSKITQENFEVFIDVWDTQVDELLTLLRNITEGHTENNEWLTIYIPMASKINS